MGHEAFYATAAQVIPVLLLAILIRAPDRSLPVFAAVAGLVVVVFCLCGEMTAVAVLADYFSDGSTARTVVGFAVLGAACLAFGALLGVMVDYFGLKPAPTPPVADVPNPPAADVE